jgi:hypothetical protein
MRDVCCTRAPWSVDEQESSSGAMLPAPLYLSVDEQSFLRGVDETEAEQSFEPFGSVRCMRSAHLPSARELRISACARTSMLPCRLVSSYIWLVL